MVSARRNSCGATIRSGRSATKDSRLGRA
jgi:hypothetical protein